MDLGQYFTPEEIQRGAEWLRLRTTTHAFGLVIDVGLLWLLSVGAPGRRLWSVLSARLRSGTDTPLDRALGGDWRTSAVFLPLVTLIRNVVAFPLTIYTDYFVAHRIGLSHESPASFLRRTLIGLVLVLAGAALLGAGLGAVRARWPRRWWQTIGVSAALLLSLDAALEPLQLRLHHTVRPLAVGALRERIERLLVEQRADVGDIMTVDASRFGTEVNAFVSGFGPTRQLILTDTLLALGDEAVMGAVAHEIGHRRSERLPLRLLLAGMAMLAFLWLVERTLRFAARLGATATAQGLPLVRLVVILLLVVTSPLRLAFNRTEEREADALELSIRTDYDAYIAEQVRLARANASDPDPPAWLSPFLSHPSPAERIAAALAARARQAQAP